MKLQHARSIDDVRDLARRRLPSPIFDIIEAGAEDERTVAANSRAFDEVLFRPRTLVDATHPTTATTILGTPVEAPILLAPTGAPRLLCRGADLDAATAAAQSGTIYVQSTAFSAPLKEIQRAGGGRHWFQLYVSDAATTDALLDHVEEAGFTVLCVTVDSSVLGSRDRDQRYRLSRAAFMSRMVRHSITKIGWTRTVLVENPDLLWGGSPRRLPSLKQLRTPRASPATAITWEDLDRVRRRWRGPLVVKGPLSGEDARRLVDVGVSGMIVSNHGGRQLDSLPASLSMLPEVADAVNGEAEIYLDGGVRRGSDVAKALALGARACLIGRPYLYGLAAGGAAGAELVLRLLHDELKRTMTLLGCSSVNELSRDFLQTDASLHSRCVSDGTTSALRAVASSHG